jgi:hypothetical protein
MELTDFDDLLQSRGTAGTKAYAQSPVITGSPITAEEVQARLSPRLYDQLSEGSPDTVVRASERAVLHVSAIYSRLGLALNIDDPVSREVTTLFTIYELHLALGNEEAGREYRLKAKDLIIAAYGEYPEAEKPATERPALGALTVPARRDWP